MKNDFLSNVIFVYYFVDFFLSINSIHLYTVGLDRNSLISSASLNQANIPYGGGYGPQSTAMPQPSIMSPKMQILNLLHSIRTVARVPLIAINIVVIIFKLLFG